MAIINFRIKGTGQDLYVNPDHVVYAYRQGPGTTTIALSVSAGSGATGSSGPKTFEVEGEVHDVVSQLNVAQKG